MGRAEPMSEGICINAPRRPSQYVGDDTKEACVGGGGGGGYRGDVILMWKGKD